MLKVISLELAKRRGWSAQGHLVHSTNNVWMAKGVEGAEKIVIDIKMKAEQEDKMPSIVVAEEWTEK